MALSSFSLRPPKEWNERAERTPSPLRRMDWWAAACFQQTHGFPEECVWLTRCVSHQFIGMSVSTQEMMLSEVLVKSFGRNEFINVHPCSSMLIISNIFRYFDLIIRASCHRAESFVGTSGRGRMEVLASCYPENQ